MKKPVMPEPIVIPIIYTEDTNGLARAAAEVQKMREASEALNEAQQKAFKETSEAVDSYGKRLQDAAGELTDLENTTKGANRENKTLSDLLKNSARNLNVFGFNVGDVIDKFKAKQVALRGVIGSLRGTVGMLQLLKVALISTGIGAILVALGSLIVLLTKSEKGVEFLERAFAGIGATINVLIDRAVALGNAMLKIFSGDFAGAVKDTKAALTGIGDEIAREAVAAFELQRAIQALEDTNRDLRVEFAKQRAEIERLREVSADDSKGFSKRAKAAQDAIKIETKLEQQRIAAAEENLRIIREQNKLREGNITDELNDKEAEAIIELEDIRAESSRRRRRDQNFFESLQRQQAALAKQLAEEERKREEERIKLLQEREEAFRKLTQAINEQLIKEELLAESEQERLEFQKDSALDALNLAEEELIAKATALKREDEIEGIRRDFARLRFLTEERFNKEITRVVEEESKKQLEALEKATDEFLQQRETVRNNRLQFVREQAGIDQQRIDLLKESADQELSLEQFKEREKLKILVASLQKQRKILLETGLALDSFDVQKLDLQLSEAEDKLTAFEALPILERIKNKFKNLFDLSEEDFKELGSQLNDIVGNVFAGLNSLFEAQIAQQDALIAKRQEAVDELESQLDHERELKEKGFANDFDATQKKLTEETELLKQEEEKRLELEKKAARLRLRQQALELASNIALSIAKAIQANAQFGLVGIVTAAAQIAAIFALIAKAKAQAAQFSKGEKLREGARLEGPTHEQGGIPLVVDDGAGGRRMYEAERDEWLIGTKPSKEHDTFLERVNKGEFHGVDLNQAVNAYVKPLTTLRHTTAPDILKNILPGIRESQTAYEAAKFSSGDALAVKFEELKNEVKAVKRAIEEKPELVSLTEMGYLERKKTGNNRQVNVYAPPKAKE